MEVPLLPPGKCFLASVVCSTVPGIDAITVQAHCSSVGHAQPSSLGSGFENGERTLFAVTVLTLNRNLKPAVFLES